MTKIKILELDFTSITSGFISYSAGIYQKTFSVSQAIQDASFWTTAFGGTWDTTSDGVTIGSIRVNDTILGKVTSIDELREQDGSFYFDSASQTIYLARFDYTNAWDYNTYKAGETTGFLSAAQKQLINGIPYPVDSYFGANYYEPRLTGDVDASISVDDQSSGIFVFDDLTATLNNGDGKYDNIRDDITGNEARILIADLADSPEEEILTGYPYKLKADFDDFEVVRIAVVEDVDYTDPNAPVVSAIDVRSDWSQTIGTNLITASEYPNVDDKYIDKRKPVLIGQVNGAECIPLADDPETSASLQYLICDTELGDIYSTDAIYFDGTISGVDYDDYLTSGMYAVDTETGILTIYNTTGGDAYFYGQVTEMTETVEIVLFLLSHYQNLSYISSNFNKEEIERVQDFGYTTHVYIDKSGDTLSDVIEKLVMDIQVDFFQQGSVLTMRPANEERTTTEDITPTEIFDNPAGWVNDRTDTVKSIAITYNQDYRTEDNTTYYNDESEQDAIDNNRKAIDYEYDSNLTNVSHVSAIWDEYYNRFTSPSRTVFVKRAFPISAGLTDFVTFSVTRKNDIDGDIEVFPRGTYKIIKKDPIDNTAEIVYFSDAV